MTGGIKILAGNLRVEVRGLAVHVLPAFFGLFIFLFAHDAAHNRLGSSNGKFISFVDTCLNVCNYREGLRYPSGKRMGIAHMLRIAASSFVIKFASGTAVSLLLGETPVWCHGPRHVLSFLVGFSFLWFCPGDAVYTSMCKSRAVRLLLGTGGGLYKVRKAIFAVEAAALGGGGFWFTLVVAVLAIDGSMLSSRVALWLQAHLAAGSGTRGVSHLAAGLRRDSRRGFWAAVCGTVLPLAAVTGSIRAASCTAWTTEGITDDSFLGLRAALLALFVWRGGTFDELALVHRESLVLAAAAAREPDTQLAALVALSHSLPSEVARGTFGDERQEAYRRRKAPRHIAATMPPRSL